MLQLNHTKHPEFQTGRLFLRPLRDEDIHELLALRKDERVNQYLDRPKDPTTEDVRAWMEKIYNNYAEKKSFYWAIEWKNGSALIGTICLFNLSHEENSGEIGFELFPHEQGKRVMSEAMQRILQFCFEELQAKRIDAWIHRENVPSLNLVAKYKFQRNTEEEEKLKDLEELKVMQIYSLYHS